MTGDLVPHTTDVQRVKAGMVFAEFGSDDPFEIAFRPGRCAGRRGCSAGLADLVGLATPGK